MIYADDYYDDLFCEYLRKFCILASSSMLMTLWSVLDFTDGISEKMYSTDGTVSLW